MYHSFLIHSSADGYLGCFHVLVIINSAVMNIGVHMPLQFWFPQCVFSALNVSPLTQTIAPMWGLDPCFSSPTH